MGKNKETFIRLITTWGAIGLTEEDQKWYDKNKNKLIKKAKQNGRQQQNTMAKHPNRRNR